MGYEINQWAAQKIAALLQMPAESCAPIVENILLYDDARELRSFLGDFTEKSAEQKVNSFVEELFERKRGGPSQPQAQQQRGGGPAREEAYPDSRGGSGRGRGGDSAGGRGRGRGGRGDAAGRGQARGGGGGGGGAPKREDADFPKLNMPMYDRPEGDRRRMVLDASSGRYEVLTNCLNCGKVVVEEEGWGPCLFCGNPLEVGDRFGLKHGDDRGFLEPVGQATAEEAKYNESFERAKATKDRLLSYDRDAKRRTKVFDDATDWYSEAVNPWLNEKQREEATRQAAEEERRKREEKRKIHATIDLFGRTVISADDEVGAREAAKNKENFQNWTEGITEKNRLLGMMQEEQRGMGGKTSQLSNDSKQLYDKLRASLHASGGQKSSFEPPPEQDKKSTRWDASADSKRVEDDFAGVSTKDFAKADTRLLPAEESPYGDSEDTGQCLSMHQPWASLLVYGFKRAEGRSWKTDHRGRLWIHAASKAPEDHDIELLEQTYRSVYEAQGVPMPPLPSQGSGYPTSVLLGCVDLEECWTKEEYTTVLQSNPSMPQEENGSDHIFWCLRPRRLVVPLKMSGDNKIWRLPKVSLSGAQRGLQPVRWPVPSDGECVMSTPALPGAAARRQAAQAAAAAAAATPAASSSSGGAGGGASASAAKAAAAPGAGKPAAAGSAARASAPPSLDLWPKEKPTERLEAVRKDQDGADRDIVVFQNGFVQLVGFVPPDMQQRVVDAIRELGVSPEGGFFAERFDGSKVSADVTRMYLGLHWNTVTQSWEKVRGNLGGAPVAALPKMLADMYDEAVKRANRELTRGPNKKRKLTPFPEGKPPDVGIANFYEPSGSMQMHQDKTESKLSMDAGYAVMGICIGDACEFTYAAEAPASGKKPKAVRLESGDVYLFGGESRMMWHGVTKVIPRTSPPSLRLIPGRLNVTLRVM